MWLNCFSQQRVGRLVLWRVDEPVLSLERAEVSGSGAHGGLDDISHCAEVRAWCREGKEVLSKRGKYPIIRS